MCILGSVGIVFGKILNPIIFCALKAIQFKFDNLISISESLSNKQKENKKYKINEKRQKAKGKEINTLFQ